MKRSILLLAAALSVTLGTRDILAGHGHVHGHHRVHMDRAAAWHNANSSWHGRFRNTQWGHPVAVIVPPTAEFQTEYSWGVGRTTMTPINYQFGRPVARRGAAGGMLHTPPWPWSTQQFGYYYVRGPW